jgi:hypothetical protein
LPSNWSTSYDPQSEAISLIGGTTATNVFQLGFGQAPFKGRLYGYVNDGATTPPTAMDTSFTSGGQYAAGNWQLWTLVYDGGTPTTGLDFADLYINGVVKAVGIIGSPTGNQVYSTVASTGGTLKIGGGAGLVSSRDNEWVGGLGDIGFWNMKLTGPFGTNATDTNGSGVAYNGGQGPALGSSGGETLAMYKTPTSGYAALQQYGVAAMDQLFTLYGHMNPTATTTITTANGALTWQYVSNGLGSSGNSGYAGYNSLTRQYFVQLDSNGGGVITVVPEPSTLALLAASATGLLVYAWRKRR